MRAELEPVLRASSPDVSLVHNDGYREGMFSSACAGVSALPPGLDGFFLLPADCCAVSSEIFSILMERFKESGGAHVVRPKYEGRRGHPPLIPGGYTGRLVSYKGENGLKGFLFPLPTVEVEMDSPCTLLDMDTPEDYARLLSYLGLPVCPSPSQCSELFVKYGTPQGIIDHGESVAAIALKIARLLEVQGEKLDIAPLESACLLHDIMRMAPDHARAGMELLLREGYPETAILVGRHMDLRYSAPDIGEAELLYLADKLCRRGRLTALYDTARELE